MDSKEDGLGYSACQEESNKPSLRSVRSSLEDRGPVKVFVVVLLQWLYRICKNVFSLCLNGPRPMKFFDNPLVEIPWIFHKISICASPTVSEKTELEDTS